MNWFVVLFVAGSLAGQAVNLKVDHATLACTDLRKLRAELASAGVPNEYGGKHRNRATEMAIASFQDGSYLELMGKQAD
ncbi:MAG: VOC family protein, partial [Acidobacteriota bacterium]|nr:VOC family protein [Acidobacteriota bacterium]